MVFFKKTFKDKINWLYLTGEAKDWLDQLYCHQDQGNVVKDYPKRSVFLCEGVYVKEVRYRGIHMILKGLYGGNACREGVISRRLNSMAVPVPDVLGYGVEKVGSLLKRDVLLTRAVRDGRNLLQVFLADYHSFSWQEKICFVNDFADFIRNLHDKNVCHKDPNLGNIICQKSGSAFKFYLIDTDQVFVKNSSLTELEKIKNLALFHSLHNQLSKTQKVRFLKKYLVKKSFREFYTYSKKLEHTALNHSLVIWKKNSEKCLGNNNRFAKVRYHAFNIYYKNTPEAEEILGLLLPNPDVILDSSTIIKNGRTVCAVKIFWKGKSYFLKRYNRKGFFYSFRNAFRASRAVRTWRVHWEFRGRRLAVPEPLVCLEERRFRCLQRSYLLTEFIENSSGLKKFYSQVHEKEKVTLLVRIAVLLGKMHRSGALHNDLKWDNFLLQQTSKGLNLFLTDLDGARISHRIDGNKKLYKDIRRFMRDFDGRNDDEKLRLLFLKCWWKWARGGAFDAEQVAMCGEMKNQKSRNS